MCSAKKILKTKGSEGGMTDGGKPEGVDDFSGSDGAGSSSAADRNSMCRRLFF